MKRSLNAMVLGLVLFVAQGLFWAEQSVVAPGAKVEKLAGEFEFTEGPTGDAGATSFSPTSPLTAS
jgi:gluconolactonase